jgi:hypothetical protein
MATYSQAVTVPSWRHIEPFAREIAELHRGDGGKIRARDQVGNRQLHLPVAGPRFFSSNE